MVFSTRSFFHDDAHIFMKEDQITDVILELLTLADKIYSTFGLTYKLELSTRPEKLNHWKQMKNGRSSLKKR